MKNQVIFLAFTALIIGSACSSQPKEGASETMPAAIVTPAPAATPAQPSTENEACEGKAAKDSCNFTSVGGEIKGACVRTDTNALVCRPKKSKK
jgi:hypothetical protein